MDALPDSAASTPVAPAATDGGGASSAFVAVRGRAYPLIATRLQLATATRLRLTPATRLQLAATTRLQLAPTTRFRLAPATVLAPAYVGASPYPTTRLRFATGDTASSAAILELACRTATILSTASAAVLSGTMLGRALCAAATACGLGLAASTAVLGTTSYAGAAAAAATVGLHGAVGALSYAAATSAVF